jgi:hypothetical protein
MLREMADEIQKRRVVQINDVSITHVFYMPIGKNWVSRFVLRHPQLQTVLGHYIESSRIKGATKDALNQFFDAFVAVIEKYQITMENIYNVDETGCALGMIEATRIIIDANIRSQYQTTPGRQEWVSVMECICANGTIIPPLVIFKGENLTTTWIPPATLKAGWAYACNSNGWTSNIHGLEWLQRSFEPATREKANGRKRLLIADGHDSHVSGNFLAHCLNNDIELLLLPPHTSHLLQPLDVGVFGPLKKAISARLNRLISTGISRLQKYEWAEAYLEARNTALSSLNVEAGWRGAGLFPLDRTKVLRRLPRPITPPPTEPMKISTPFDTITSSPPDSTSLHTANIALNQLVATRKPLHTPARKYVNRLANTAERQHAEISILRRERDELRQVLSARKERLSGKRLILKGKSVVTSWEIQMAIAAKEKETVDRKKKKKVHAKRMPAPSTESESESKDDDDEQGMTAVEISDCIIVERC